jgi:hypothetical protein
MPFPVENRAGLAANHFASLSAILAQHRSFKSALDWMLTATPPLRLVQTLAQDEFSYDAIVLHPDGFWIVYDVT